MGGERTSTGGAVNAAMKVVENDPWKVKPNRPALEGLLRLKPVTCVWYSAEIPTSAELGPGARVIDPGDELAKLIPVGTPVVHVCTEIGSGGTVSARYDLWPGVPAAQVYVSPEVLALQARAQLELPAPRVRSWPPPEKNFVAVQTWFRVDPWQTDTRTATAGNVSATVVATPVRAVWHLHEATLICAGPGREYRTGDTDAGHKTDCGYMYQNYSGEEPDKVYKAWVDVIYHLTWTSNIGVGGDLGEVASTTRFPIRVWEVQALING